MKQYQYLFWNFYRASFKAAADTIQSSLTVAQRLHNHQLTVIKDAMASNGQFITIVGDTNEWEELAAVPGKFVNIQSQMVRGCWNSFYQMANECQNALANRLYVQTE